MKIFEVVVSAGDGGKRLDKFLVDKINEIEEYKEPYSRTRIKKIIEDGLLLRNGNVFVSSSCHVAKHDKISIVLDNIMEVKLEKANIELNIVYEDEDVLVINKQAGLTTHPGFGNYNNTLVNALLYHKNDSLSGICGVLRPGIVHRLDKDTSGLMVVAKNDLAHNDLSQQLKDRILKRTYYAFVWGKVLPPSGCIDGFLGRHNTNKLKMVMTNNESKGKYSKTNYVTIENFSDFATLLKCNLDTGRTHQIRVHFSSKQHPLIGDHLYGGNARKMKGGENEYKNYIDNFWRQALHSKEINFIQPRTKKELHFEIPLPDDLIKLRNCLEVGRSENS